MTILLDLQEWLEAFHIISVMFWMAGMYYLPRLFVYHAEAMEAGEPHQTFEKMEHNLLRIIMNPALIATWIFGSAIVIAPRVLGGRRISPTELVGFRRDPRD
jgi:putative membrane protein